MQNKEYVQSTVHNEDYSCYTAVRRNRDMHNEATSQ